MSKFFSDGLVFESARPIDVWEMFGCKIQYLFMGRDTIILQDGTTVIIRKPRNQDMTITTGNIPGEGENPEVDHPAHYNQHPSGVECIEVVRHMGFNLGNVVKYLWRDGLKDTQVELQDLEKAAWYLNNEIERRKGE